MPSNSDENAAPPCERTCSQSKCKAKLPSDYNKNTCPNCYEASRMSMARKRKRDKEEQGARKKPILQPTTAINTNARRDNPPQEIIYVKSDDKLTSDENQVSSFAFSKRKDRLTKCLKENVAVTFKDSESTLTHLQKVFKTMERIFFHGCYNIPEDPEITDKERVQMTAQDIWKATGFCFR